jgi:hypothetical protein
MSKVRDLRPDPDLPAPIKQAANDGKLVLFVGAGASMLLGMPSWGGLAYSALNSLRNEGYINFAELNQLQALDPKKQLSIARVIADENGFDLDLPKHLKSRGASKIYDYLNSIGAVYVTTNYDHELMPITPESDPDKLKESVKRISLPRDFNTVLLKNPGTVIHLHGDMLNPKSMVVTTRDYLQHYDHVNVISFLGKLFDEYTVLFIGYGLEEADILEHVLRRGGVRQEENATRRYSLQGFFNSEQPLYEKLIDYYDRSFGVELVGFTRDNRDYAQLEKIIKDWADEIDVRPPPATDDIADIDRVVDDE